MSGEISSMFNQSLTHLYTPFLYIYVKRKPITNLIDVHKFPNENFQGKIEIDFTY